MAEKRKRSPNWLSSEKHLLLDIVQNHLNVVENKKTDAVTMKKKTAEWIAMSAEYNSQTPHCDRTAENLKAQWESMKKAAKREASNIRMHFIQTGGGPPNPKTEDAFYNRVLGLIKQSVAELSKTSQDPLDSGLESHNAVSPSIESHDSQSLEVHVKIEADLVPDGTPSSEAVTEPWFEVSTVEDGPCIQNCASLGDAEIKSDWDNTPPLVLQTPISRNLTEEIQEKNRSEKKEGTLRKRPILPASSLDLHNRKVEAIVAQKQHADCLFKINMAIKEEELKIKKEELKQNKIKTRLLMLELKLKKETLTNSTQNNFN